MHQERDKSNEPDPCRMSANMAAETVPNEIPNDCNMATELVPNKIEHEYRIVYRMASPETVEITTKR
jgi:hypothetical protein